MYNDTITLFNRYQDQQSKVWWYPSILHGVNLNMDKAFIIAKYGPASADNAMLNVRYTIKELSDGDPQCEQIPWLTGKKLIIGDKIWLPASEWDAHANDMPSKIITFDGGHNFDFFWFGEWTGAGVISDGHYASDEGFYGYMNRTYDYVFAITAVGGPYTVIPHFEIMGK